MKSFQVSCIALCAIALSAVSASATSIFEYSWPDSGLTPVIEDLSAADNDANPGNATLSGTVPGGVPVGAQSLATHDGGAVTQNPDLLENAAIAAAGGFRFDTQFMWDGTNDSGSTILIQKIIDYAGTESLQIEDIDLVGGTAILRFLFNDANEGPTATILANQWYDVSAVFATSAGVQGDGSLPGVATLTVDGTPVSQSISKSDFGDSLDRPIGIGGLSVAPTIIELHGYIYNPSVSLIPEPSTALLGLLALVSLGLKNRNLR